MMNQNTDNTFIHYDKLVSLEDSKLQHGSYNDRVYLMKLGERRSEEIIEKAQELAEDNSYSKIFAKSRESQLELFESQNFEVEAEVPGLYKGEEKIYFLGKYLNSKRREIESDKVESILKVAHRKGEENFYLEKWNRPGLNVRELKSQDAEEMAAIYKIVFKTYPFPIHDPNYLIKIMAENVRAFGVFKDGSLISLASCEMDREQLNVEMTDFATLPKFRGHKLANILLSYMEEKMAQSGIKVAYTIARSFSTGMNVTFSRSKYRYTGTLKNNTNISGNIESMNVWHKAL